MQIVFVMKKSLLPSFSGFAKIKNSEILCSEFCRKPRFHEIRVDKRRRDAFVTLLRRFSCVGFVPKRRNKTKPISHLNIFDAILNSV